MQSITSPSGLTEVLADRRPRRFPPERARQHGFLPGQRREGREPLRVAMLAPPWISVPPPGYGGVESVVSVLTEALVRRGHAVTLFCAPDSVSSAEVVTLLDEPHPDEIERSLYEVDHVAQAFAAIDRAPHGHKAALVGISRAQLASAPADLQPAGAIPNPIDLGAWPLREHKDDYL